MEKDPDTGRRVKRKVQEYEYEAEMEAAYRYIRSLETRFVAFLSSIACFGCIGLSYCHTLVHFPLRWVVNNVNCIGGPGACA